MSRVGTNEDGAGPGATPRTRHRAWLAIPAAALALAASACGSSASPATSTAAGSAKVPLAIYAAEGYDTTVAKAFQQATGIPTSVYDAHTGIVVSKIEQEKNNPQWGVTWFDGDMAMSTLDQQGLLLKGWQPQAAWNARGQGFLPADKSYVPTGYRGHDPVQQQGDAEAAGHLAATALAGLQRQARAPQPGDRRARLPVDGWVGRPDGRGPADGIVRVRPGEGGRQGLQRARRRTERH
jgi:hypothetical protein